MKQPPEGQPLNPFSDSDSETPANPYHQPTDSTDESHDFASDNLSPDRKPADQVDEPTLDLGEQPIIGRYQMSPEDDAYSTQEIRHSPDDRPAAPRRAVISPEDLPSEESESERPKRSRLAVGLMIAGVVLFFGLVAAVGFAVYQFVGIAETASELSPGKCVVVTGPDGDTTHQVHDCEVSEKHAWKVANNPANDQCGADYFYYSKKAKVLGIELGGVRSCLAPLLHEGKCYLEDKEGVVPTDCTAGAIEATRVAQTGDAAVCPDGTGVLNYPEIPVTYCLRRVQ